MDFEFIFVNASTYFFRIPDFCVCVCAIEFSGCGHEETASLHHAIQVNALCASVCVMANSMLLLFFHFIQLPVS